MSTQMVIAEEYQLTEMQSIQSGTWKKDGAKKFLRKKVYERDYVDLINSQNSNIVFVILEDETKAFYEQREQNIIENNEREKKSKLTTADLIDVMIGKKSKSDTPDETWDVEDLKQYCIDNNIDFAKQSGKKKLLELINNQ